MYLKAKKSLGQNFLTSSKTAEKIAKLAGDLEHFNVIEIGPGYGSLTKEILKLKPKSLLAIEKDQRLIEKHNDLLTKYDGKYRIIEADALHIKESDYMEEPVKLIANLPYSISVALLSKWLHNITFFTNLTLMFQKEVADRIVAQPNSKNYGSLSIISQLLCNVRKVFDINPKEFFPEPKVYSSVIILTPLETPRFPININVLTKLMRIVFSQRRKMIRTSLKNRINDIESIFEQVRLTGSERPENLTIEQFCILATACMHYF